ncbi:hypothetical protein [Domibacillus epiphyticus]|uniref:Uncharacterized protein n=1 Tax=Domibacillus epiphyticus TaxID=1714355 RepID=A0A1V2A797_9BACI|nr:hypothetical protein [Domibacillus epiphyticus]OMP66883.1 hypothetical protein BTO28_09730 [Domibacillus epiphyticus]
MTIYEALRNIHWKKAEYFKFKFPDVRYDQSVPVKSEDELMKSCHLKSMNSFYAWERTDEYKSLLMLYMASKVSDDFMEIYNIVIEQAKQGDDKAIKTFLSLQKEIRDNAKVAEGALGSKKKKKQVEVTEKEDEPDEFDDLDLS